MQYSAIKYSIQENLCIILPNKEYTLELSAKFWPPYVALALLAQCFAIYIAYL